jgi:hypothetical protein
MDRESTKHLEAAYEGIYERYQLGLPPEHIRVESAPRSYESARL